MTLEKLLKEHEDTIVRVKRRLYFLLEFEKQVKSITQDKKYRIKNDIIAHLIDDAWSMLIIDFASLAKGMLGSGGFFNYLKTNLNEVKPVKRKEIEPPKGNIHFAGEHPTSEEFDEINSELDKNFIELIMKANRETLFELFPNARGRNPVKIRHEDVDALKQRFEGIITDVVDDRNKNRAHKYEQIQDKSSYEKLGIQKIADKFKQIEQMINQIRSIVSQSEFTYSDMNYANKKEVARDLTIMILWGSNRMIDIKSGLNSYLSAVKDINSIDRVSGYVFRENLIENSQNYHNRIMQGDLKPDTNTDYSDKDFCFNDIDLEKMRKKGL